MISLKYLFIVLFISKINYSFSDQNDSLVDIGCTTTSDCQHFKIPHHNVTCLDGQCVCNNLNNGVQTPCVPDPTVSSVNNVIGGRCPCNQPNSICIPDKVAGGICYCEKDYVATNDKRRCIKKMVELGEPCEDDSQCIYQEKFSECNMQNKTCECQQKFVQNNGGCVSIIDLNETCENNSQCQNKTSNSICINRKCGCDKKFVANQQHNKCLPTADYNEKCEETVQCVNELGVGSECYSGLCKCDSTHVLVEEKDKEYSCQKKIEIGAYCREHNDCYQYKLGTNQQSMKCFLTECVCQKGYHVKDKGCMINGNERNLGNKILLIIAIILTVYMSLDNKIYKNYIL